MKDNSEIIIKKVKIVDDLFLEVEYFENQPDGDTTTQHEYKALLRNNIHDDLRKAFEKLKVHLAFLSEFIETNKYEEDDFETGQIFLEFEFDKFKVVGFTLGGDQENAGVTLSGRRILKGNRVLNLNSPFTKFKDQEGVDSYRFLYLLYSHINQCIAEVKLYLGGKHAPKVQIEISFK